ncbi:flagellar hook-associated protein FlgK [Caproiciproducens sp. CPB-2]|uniref:flagellar hook-associated protein FlgK n=1 Tax=Caproiciproducens sp. CPB-2 TaxID=3030017 RepID=UPI0023DBFE39|nr:flagellar hook-associated protein FlgK [Caproiciproducens sp. CPB-2]MDF1494231.1 flagellar hook-associated protein FlgK [Caproiciproducens sp. CPB-2]
MSSTFSGFYVAKSGIQAARANLQITGQNMTNVNTTGYTRQRVDSYSLGPTGNNMRYTGGNLAIGNGVYCSGTSQIRDPYLDIRYRAEHAYVGKTDVQLDTLSDLEDIFDESSKDGLSAQFSDLITQLNTLASSPTYSSENIVKNSAMLLTKAFNSASQQLSKIRKEQTKSLQDDAITKVNNLLKNIAHLNQEIKSSEISGTSALELTDQRNTMIDELSKYANIEVSTKTVGVGSDRSVSELHIDLVSGDQKFSLVANGDYSEFSMTTNSGTGYVTMALKDVASDTPVQAVDSDGTPLFDSVTGDPVVMGNTDLTEGAFGGYLSMLNESGEFDPVTGERGLGYYEKMLDKLAVDFADTMNQANSTNESGVYNKPLFTTTDGTSTTGITAGNISISTAWNTATSSYITATKQTGDVDTSSNGDNVLYMINQLGKDKTYTTNANNTDGTTLFTTSIDSFISDLSVSVLALQKSDVNRQNTTYNSTLTEIDTQRASISSVDVNEEGINLIMYNQSLTASSRFMTTLDEALDTIINKMGIVGR